MLSPLFLTTALLLANLTTLTTSSPVPPLPQNSPPLMTSSSSIPTPTTLQPGAYWIRAVVPPNYHKYLQTKPANLPAPAILDSYTAAGQFNIIDGQLVNKVSSPPLYLWVEEPSPANSSPPPRTLATWFNTTRNPFGTFAWQGDSLTWSVASIKRQNVAAWLVCNEKEQKLFVNTGAYGYQTPSGCADQTIHYYNDKTANN